MNPGPCPLSRARGLLYGAEDGEEGSILVWAPMSYFSLHSHMTRGNSSSPASTLPSAPAPASHTDRRAAGMLATGPSVCLRLQYLNREPSPPTGP